MNNIKLNICSIGDPTNSRTWSGTPYHIYCELVNQDCFASSFDSSASKYERKLLNLISKIYYQNSVDFERGIFHRYYYAGKVKRKTNLSLSNLTLHTGTFDLPFYKLPKNQKHYLFCDSTWALWSAYSTTMNGYKKKLLSDAEKMEEISYHQMEHIFTTSTYVKNNLISHYNINSEKITVVGTGLGIIKPFYGLKNYSNNKILFVAKGRFKDKGGYLVLDAFKLALKSNPNLELIIVGQNEYTEKINLPNVKAFGYVPINKLQSIFETCSLFLMPAINEPWGLVYLEALACKMPIVGLNRNSFPEISGYGEYGFALNDTDPVKLAEILLNAFAEPQNLAVIGKRGQDYCLKEYTWQKTVKKIIETINNLQ